MDKAQFPRQSHTMFRATTLLLFSIALAVPAMAAPRFAVVRITDIYRNLTSTHTMMAELQKERNEIIKDERATHLRKILEELKEIQKQLQERKDAPIDDTTRKLAQSFEMKRQEAQTLEEEFRTFDSEKRKEINRKMVVGMRASLSKIDTAARKISQEQGFDATFDSSGLSNTTVPILLYAKKPNDLTDDVIAFLKDSGEPSGAPATAPTATPDPAAGTAPAPSAAPTAPN